MNETEARAQAQRLANALGKKGKVYLLPVEANPHDEAALIDAAVKAIEETATEVDYSPATPVRHNGVYDPGILKAIFLAGGPGSGKSYTANALFGVPSTIPFVLASVSGLKIVNSDPFFEVFLAKAGIDPKSLATMPAEQFDALGAGPDSPRGKASRVRDGLLKRWLDGRIGLIMDGTGYDFDHIRNQSERLRALGYDTMMLFVNTSLPVAQKRNLERGRSLPEHIVEDVWNHVQANLGKFQEYFGPRNMIIADNTKYGPVPAALQKAADRFVRMPVENRIGKKWIADQLAARRRNPGAGAMISAAKRFASSPTVQHYAGAVASAAMGAFAARPTAHEDFYRMGEADGRTHSPRAIHKAPAEAQAAYRSGYNRVAMVANPDHVLAQINEIRSRLAQVTLDDSGDAHNDLERVLSAAETLNSGFYHLLEDTAEQVADLVTDIETARDEVMDQLIDRGYETGRKVAELVDGDIVPRLEAALDRVEHEYLREKRQKKNPSGRSADPSAARKILESSAMRDWVYLGKTSPEIADFLAEQDVNPDMRHTIRRHDAFLAMLKHAGL